MAAVLEVQDEILADMVQQSAIDCSAAASDAAIYDPQFVKGVFDRRSNTYIAFSFICSFGFTERWRKQCVACLNPSNQQNPAGYDLMSGTGEVWPHLWRRFPNVTHITAVDISSGMHACAINRMREYPAHKINFIEDNALATALPADSADFLVSTFGLKTFNADQHQALAKLVAHVLKPGGAFSLIEASDPKGWVLRPLYLLHLRYVLPLIEKLFVHGAQDLSMISRYTVNFGDATAFAAMLRAEGLHVEVCKFFCGCVTGVHGRKPIANGINEP